MITNKRLNQYRHDLEHASTDAKEQLQAVLTTYLQQTPNVSTDDIKQYTLDAIKDVLGVFGDEACMLANELLEEVAYTAGKDVTTQIYDTFNEKKAEVHVSWLADTYFINDVSAYLAHAGDSAAFYVKREAFENMQQNCNSNKARWARVPSGRETCGFCFMLASRGFDYYNKKSAGGDGHQFHRHCDCLIVPSFSAQDQDAQVQGYKPTKLYERYSKCEQAVKGGLNGWDNTQFLADVKAGLCNADEWEKWKLKRICAEIETRDANWLWKNEEITPTFASLELEDDVKKNRPQELVTAKRLVKHGVRADFRIDYIDYINEETGRKERKGLADFSNGYEIKTLEHASSYNTINNHLKNASKKGDCVAVVFDNTDNIINAEQLKKLLIKAQSFHRGRVYILDGEDYWRVR